MTRNYHIHEVVDNQSNVSGELVEYFRNISIATDVRDRKVVFRSSGS